MRKRRIIAAALIAVVGFTVFSGALKGKFILDDTNLIRNNPYIKSFSFLPRAFTRDLGDPSGERYNFYRPVQVITYMFDYLIWRYDPAGYHLTSIILHILTALAFYAFVVHISGSDMFALFAAMPFLLHPVNVEAVAFISARDNILVTLFLLSAFISYVKLTRGESGGRGLYPWMVGSYLLALFSKGSALVFPLMALAYHYAFRKDIKKAPFFSLCAAAGAYSAARVAVLGGVSFHVNELASAPGRIWGLFAALAAYGRALIAPYRLHMKIGSGSFHLSDPPVIWGIAIAAALLAYLWAARRRRGWGVFSVCCFFLGFAPAANIYPVGAYMADRWLYLPAIGFFIALARLFSAAYVGPRLKRPVAVMFTFLLICYSAVSISQVGYWREPVAFFRRSIEITPDSYRMYEGLGNALSDLGRNEEAVKAYEKTIKLEPSYASAYNNMGNSYFYMGRSHEALGAYKEALELDPGSAKVRYNLGNFYYNRSLLEDAITSYAKAIDLNPGFAPAYNSLAKAIFAYKEDAPEAIRLLNKAVDIDPYYTDAYNNLAVIFNTIDRPDDAAELFRKVLRIDPGHAVAHYNLGRLYHAAGEHGRALRHFTMAERLGYNVEPEFLEKDVTGGQ